MDFLPTTVSTIIISLVLIIAYSLLTLNTLELKAKLSSLLRTCARTSSQISEQCFIPKQALRSPFGEAREIWPNIWWTDQKHFDLEQKVIFRKSWLFVAHASEFNKPGDYQTFELSGFPVLVILGKDMQIRAFHNVCRHRAYVVTRKEKGSSTVLGCRYHGWSYDTRGKLIKAPEFDHVPGFNRSINGLWEISVDIQESLIFVNLDKQCVPQHLGEARQRVLRSWRLEEMTCIAQWIFDPKEKNKNNFNWKLLGHIRFDESRPTLPIWWGLRQVREDEFLSPTTRICKLSGDMVLIINAKPEAARRTILHCTVLARKEKSSAELSAWKARVQRYVEELTVMATQMQDCTLESNPSTFQQQYIAELLTPYMKNTDSSRQVDGFGRSLTSQGMADNEFCLQLEHEKESDSICQVHAEGLLDW